MGVSNRYIIKGEVTIVGFCEEDIICKECSGYGNQLFMCYYCENHDHFNKKKIMTDKVEE